MPRTSTDSGTAAGEAGTTGRRSALATAVMANVVMSAIAFVIMAVGDLAGWKGFSESKTDNSVIADVIWVTFSVGALVAFVLGIVTLIRSRSGGRGGDRMAGIAGVAWLPLTAVIMALVDAVS